MFKIEFFQNVRKKKMMETFVMFVYSFFIAFFLTIIIGLMLGFSPIRIVGQSMEPTIQKGDVVIIKSIKEKELKLQDIITFAESKNSLTTHRVVRIDEAGKIYVKGDNGISEDNVPIEFSQVKGRVVYILKGSGKFFDYVCEISNLTFIILSFVAINLINSIVKKL